MRKNTLKKRRPCLGTSAKLDGILAAVAKLDIRVDAVSIDLNLLHTDQRKVAERVTQVETEVAALALHTKELQAQLVEFTNRVGFWSTEPKTLKAGPGAIIFAL